jgi:peptide/nickel transport system permease protein
VLLWLVIGIFGPYLVPYDAKAQDFARLTTPTWKHPLGTDSLGRDMFSRTIVGGRTALQIAFSSVAIAVVVGTALGLYCAFFRGWVDLLVSRLIDIMLSIPPLVFALLIVGVRGNSRVSVIEAIVFVFIPVMVRVMRSSALTIVNMDYILAARSTGASNTRLIWRHILPNAASYLIVLASVWTAQAIIISASLAFLGLGVEATTPDWGRMLAAEALTYMLVFPWIIAPPALFIFFSVFTFNLFGDALRDVLYQSDR